MQLAATELSSLYRLIGQCLISELDAPAIEMLRSTQIASVLEKLEPDFEAYVKRDWTAKDFEDAAVEYCGLFVLPGGAPLRASSWIAGSEVEHTLVAGVEHVLMSFELSIDQLAVGNLSKDNIGLLLFLAAHLFEVDASEQSRFGHDFVTNFVLPWAPVFSEALLAKSHNPVYRAMSLLLVATMELIETQK